MNKGDVPILQCRELTKIFTDGAREVPVLSGAHFSVSKGECVAIMGASGSGKSTFLQILGGLDRPTTGRVQLLGQDISALTEKEKGAQRNQQLGFVYQFHHLLPEFNALENVAMPLLIRGLSLKEAARRAMVLIADVGLAARALHRVGALSGGERQRVAIARALVGEPRCVLADEPTGNLDNETAAQVFDIMMRLNRERGTAFVMVTHNEVLAHKHDRVLILERGVLRSA